MSLLKITPWTIESADSSAENKDFLESIFSQGNGYMGVRGYSPEGTKKNRYERSTFLSGFFEYIKPGTTDMVNMPDFSSTLIKIDGEDINECKAEKIVELLNMKDATLCKSCVYITSSGKKALVDTIRLLSLANEHSAAIQIKITALDNDISASIETGIDADIVNLPVSDDQLESNLDETRLWGNATIKQNVSGGGIACATNCSKREVAMDYRLNLHNQSYKTNPNNKNNYVGEIITTNIAPNECFTLDKLISVYSYRDCANPEKSAFALAEELKNDGFPIVFEAHQRAWSQMWHSADVELDCDDELQGAVRYNIFQLIQTDPQTDPKASIGARGLMHGRYKGCYFWDTEIFMLPMLLHINPDAAKNLLLYRYNTLCDALESAKGFSLKGARYPWMASDTGYEQCGTWDTGCCEIHITADISYAIKRYLELSSNEEFFKENAVEMFIQTARYWASRFTYDKAVDKFNLLFVKGPDEYCGVTTNNYYTVTLASLNLSLAAQYARKMKKNHLLQWKSLVEKLSFSESELDIWENISSKTVKQQNSDTKLWAQDDTFDKLEPLNFESYKEDNVPLYHKISFDRLQRYKVLKQPDVIMLMSLLPENYTVEEKLAAWDYYEPKTLHDSTLSFGIHAMFAATIGKKEKAWDYFGKSIYLDLHNVMKNTAREGLHTAAFGASWQALIFGFAGLWINEEKIVCAPNLPDNIKAMRFKVWHKGEQYEIVINNNGSSIFPIT